MSRNRNTAFVSLIILACLLLVSIFSSGIVIGEDEPSSQFNNQSTAVDKTGSIESSETTSGSTQVAPTSILGYHNLTEVENKLQNIAKTYPSIAKLYNLGNLYPHQNSTPKRTFQGRSIYALKLSDNPAQNESSEPDVLYMGLHHSREWITVEVVIYFLEYILNNYQTNSTIWNIINNTELWIVPVVNPDGFHYSQYGRDDINNSNGNQWRKNLNETNGNPGFQNPSAATGDGVDLNRNYGYKWGYDNFGSSGDPNNHLYRGSGPFSEVETQLIRDLSIAMQFKLAISFHSHSQVILFPWAYDDYDTPHDLLFNEIAKNMSHYNNYIYGNPKDGVLYNCNGETCDWLYSNMSCLAFTFELGTLFIPPTSQILPICQKNLEPCFIIAKIADDPFKIFNSGISGQVTTSRGDPLPGVNVSTTLMGSPLYCITNITGHYQLRLPPGTFSLHGQKDGYWLRSVNDISVLDKKYTTKDFTMIDSKPPVVSTVWVDVDGQVESTISIGSLVRVNVEEQFNEANLTGLVEIESKSQKYYSGEKALKYNETTGNYYCFWNTSKLSPSTDYVIEADLKDYDFNLDANGSNDTGPDLILELSDLNPPIVSRVDTEALEISVSDTDERYELGTTVRVLVYEQSKEKWLNGTVRIISQNISYDSDIQDLTFDETENYYYWDWFTMGLPPSDDYAIETTLNDHWSNIDSDGLPASPDIIVILEDTTPPVITRVDSSVRADSDEVYELGELVKIIIEVEELEEGLSGYVTIKSPSTGYDTLIEDLKFDNLKEQFYVLWNTSGLQVSNDFFVEAAMADLYLNYDSDGALNNAPDLKISLEDNTPPEVQNVYSFVGLDLDNLYEQGSWVWVVVEEKNSEMNLSGTIRIQSMVAGFDSGIQELQYDDEVKGYVWLWDTSLDGTPLPVSSDYEIETTLNDKFGNRDLDGLSKSPDLTISLEDTTPPEISAVWSHNVGTRSSTYECGSIIQIVVEERNSEPKLTGTIQIVSKNANYDSGIQQLVWDSLNGYYIFTWFTQDLLPSADYSIETTLSDIWQNVDADGLTDTPDLTINLVDTIAPKQVTDLIIDQDSYSKIKVNLSWTNPEPDTKAHVYRITEQVLNLSDHEPIIIIGGDNFADVLPLVPGTYYYFVLVEDAVGNLNTDISDSNSGNVTISEPQVTDKPDDKESDEQDYLWLLILIAVISSVLVVIVILFYLRKKKNDEILN
jgi:murein tripeptide amidase MpaA